MRQAVQKATINHQPVTANYQPLTVFLLKKHLTN